MGNTYEEGYVDAIRAYGEICSSNGNCSSCPIGQQLGEGTSCAEFARTMPDRFTAILKTTGVHSFYNEFTRRFPKQDMSVTELANNVCRKVVFEGYFDCAGGDCVACWNERYTNDVTMKNNSNNKGMEFNTGVNDFSDDDLSLFGSALSSSTPTTPIGNNTDNSFTNFDFLDNN